MLLGFSEGWEEKTDNEAENADPHITAAAEFALTLQVSGGANADDTVDESNPNFAEECACVRRFVLETLCVPSADDNGIIVLNAQTLPIVLTMWSDRIKSNAEGYSQWDQAVTSDKVNEVYEEWIHRNARTPADAAFHIFIATRLLPLLCTIPNTPCTFTHIAPGMLGQLA